MYTNEDLVARLQKLARELGRTPSKEEWKKATGIVDKTLYYHFNCGGVKGVPYDIDVDDKYEYWVNFLVMAGLPPYDYTKETLLLTARRIARRTKNGFIDPNIDWFLPHMAVYKYFGTWDNFMSRVRIFRFHDHIESDADLPYKTLEEIVFEVKLLEDQLKEKFPEAKITISF